jgi:hypothetical protein
MLKAEFNKSTLFLFCYAQPGPPTKGALLQSIPLNPQAVQHPSVLPVLAAIIDGVLKMPVPMTTLTMRAMTSVTKKVCFGTISFSATP